MQTARVKWVGKEQFLGVGPSGHAVALDSDREANTAPGPMEMLLVALGACTATDVVIILGKKRQPLESLEVEVSGERAAEPPKVWTKLEILYKLHGALDEKAVRDAIALSEEKYCSVSAMLKKTAAVSTRFEITRPSSTAQAVDSGAGSS
jgi:putative redox protein